MELVPTEGGTMGGKCDGTAGVDDAESARVGVTGVKVGGDVWALEEAAGGVCGAAAAAGEVEGEGRGLGKAAADPKVGRWWTVRLARRQGRSAKRVGQRCGTSARAARNWASAGSAHCANRARWRARTRGGSRWAEAPWTTARRTLIA